SSHSPSPPPFPTRRSSDLFYISSHPLTQHERTLGNFATHTTREAASAHEGAEVLVGGMISRLKKVITKNGRSAGMAMAIITLERSEEHTSELQSPDHLVCR